MGKFTELPISSKLFQNLDEAALTSTYAATENAFVTEASGISRFPGLKVFADFGNRLPVYLGTINNDLIAVSADGITRRLDKAANAQAIPGPQVLGGRRVNFAKDRSYLYMAAGSRIIAYDGVKNFVLSDDAPNASHVAISDNFVLANEIETEFFQNSNAGDPKTWSGLDIFSANAKPDNVTALLVTDFNEIIVVGPDSIEQYAPLVGGTAPFTRRWSVGDGISEPNTLMFADNAVWGLNQLHEFTRYSGQTGQVVSGDIEKKIMSRYSMAHLDTFDDAWAAPLHAKGQTFILLQFPSAANDYGSKGVTYLLDVRQSKLLSLYGWDNVNMLPAIWPGVSILRLWGRNYIGGYGKIYEMTDDAYNIGGLPMRMYLRTAHYNELGLIRIDSMRVTVKRGVGSYTVAPRLGMRVNRDFRGFGSWQWLDLGETGIKDFVVNSYGAQGDGYTWQFEFMVTDDCPVEIRKIEAETTPLVR